MNMKIFNDLCRFVLLTSSKYNIDESHDISHSMNVLHFAHNIYEQELYIHPGLEEHKNIVYYASTLHDMCDKKYMDEKVGLNEIENYLDEKITKEETDAILSIISTMSYSKVKKDGYPDLGIYQKAYHVVREADLLSAYDFDRCIIYDIKVKKNPFETSFYHAEQLFNNRVLKHGEDNLFTTEYAKNIYPSLHSQSIQRINTWKKILLQNSNHVL